MPLLQMKNPLLTYLLLSVAAVAYSQVEDGCIFIDFESLPQNDSLYEGLIISDQFEEAFGLTFELEGGGHPVLAEIGAPQTAFAGPGPGQTQDTPAPGVDMGRFFITDDGVLGSNLISPPLILRFSTPIDSFAGCIVDVDFGEVFILEARDSNENVLVTDTLRAADPFTGTPADPGTGDGLLTCWGFNLPGCEGSIYSIKFSGTRVQSGGFGLGMDHFSFCYSGLNVEFAKEEVTCSQLGTIEVRNIGLETYEYSMDGVNYSPDGFFPNLDAGTYTVFVRDSDNCEAPVDITIEEPPPSVLEIEEVSTSCNEDNGIIMLTAIPDNGAQYSIDDGTTYNPASEFTDLSPGEYLVRIKDTLDCYDFGRVTILPSVEPYITDVSSTQETCNNNNGSISIEAAGGTGSLYYSVDGNNYVAEDQIYNLDKGMYTIYVKDEMDCIISDVIEVREAPPPEITGISVTAPDCFETNGALEVEYSGGIGNLSVSLDNINYQNGNIFQSLGAGEYTVHLQDETGCAISESIEINIPLCDIYIPNFFSPYDNENDQFRALTNVDYGVIVQDYRIYDRWGELVFYSGQFSMHTDERQYWWDGYFNGKPAEQGVYTYLIEVKHPNEVEESYAGTLTLLW